MHGGKRQGSGRKSLYGTPTKAIRVPADKVDTIKEFIKTNATAPLFASKVQAGFPSPSDDYMEQPLNLHEHLVKHPSATFFVRAAGHSMINASIHDGDLLVVDRSLTPKHNKIVIAAIDGELTVKRYHIQNETILLMPENDAFPPISLTPENDVHIWGVVTNVIHAL